MSRFTAPGWRSRLTNTIAVLALTLGLAVFATSAFGDAGNPILGTITGSAVDNGDGTVTISVRGQWNWLSHSNDCNRDRAATGVGIIWHDPTEPGYTVAKDSISERVGIASLRSGDTVNKVDRMVHPVDRGNVPEGYTVSGTDYPAGQLIVDPTPPGITAAQVAAWRGGCGRLPLSATASKGSHPERTGLTCGNGTLACAGHPWGSWGYEKTYSHTYLASALPSDVCVNFYDVHGGGKNSLQRVESAKDITVNRNEDNSIQTNSFNVSAGSNCISTSLIVATLGTDATSATVGGPIHDTAHLAGVAAGTGGTITFRAYGPRPLDSTAPDCSTLAFTSAAASVNGAGDYGSGDFTPTLAGQYDWTASYSGDGFVLGTAGPCGAANETSVVNEVPVPQPAILIAANPPSQTVATGSPATFTITVTNTGNTVLANVTVANDSIPGCDRTQTDLAGLASMAPGASVSYPCTIDSVLSNVTNIATATGTPPAGPDVTSSASTDVTVAGF